MDLPAEVVQQFKISTSVPLVEDKEAEVLKVQTGIPFKPEARKKYKYKKSHPRKGQSKYPLAKMRPPRENGDMDSFFVEYNPERTETQNKQRIASLIHVYKKKHPHFKGAFKYRIVDEKPLGKGVRVWRTK